MFPNEGGAEDDEEWIEDKMPIAAISVFKDAGNSCVL